MAGNNEERRRSAKTDLLLGVLIPLVIIGLSIADFIRDGNIDKYLIGSLLIFGLGSLGWRIDSIIDKWLDRRNNGSP